MDNDFLIEELANVLLAYGAALCKEAQKGSRGELRGHGGGSHPRKNLYSLV